MKQQLQSIPDRGIPKGACLSTVGSYSPVKGRIMGAMYDLGVC